MRYLVSIALCLIAVLDLKAQDPQFTQFYAAPTFLNPALAGTSTQSRFSGNYRLQWPGIPGAFRVENVAFDHFAPAISSGFGLIATREKMGSGGLQNLTVGLQYAFEARITRDFHFRPAFQLSYGHRSIDFSGLTFNDQLIRPDGVASLETPLMNPVNFFDMGTGFLMSTSRWWLGAAVHHLNQPDESLYQNNPAILERKYSVHGGWRKRLKGSANALGSTNLVAAFNYKAQGKFDQLDIGAYLELNPIVIGVWYRNLPFKSNNEGYWNHDAVSVLLGYHTGRYKFGYSYDITVSQLGIGQSGGSHELSLSYEWANKRNIKLAKRRIVPCAKF